MWRLRKTGTGKEYAAADLRTLQYWCRDGKVLGDDLVRSDEDADWRPAGQVFDLAGHLRRVRQPAPTMRSTSARGDAAARGRARADTGDIEPDLTSMMDMAFILVILLIVISTPAFNRALPPVKLPEAGTIGPVQQAEDVTVSVDDQENITIAGLPGEPKAARPVGIAELERQLGKHKAIFATGRAKLVLRGDRSIVYGTIVRVMDTVMKVGIRDISMAVDPPTRDR